MKNIKLKFLLFALFTTNSCSNLNKKVQSEKKSNELAKTILNFDFCNVQNSDIINFKQCISKSNTLDFYKNYKIFAELQDQKFHFFHQVSPEIELQVQRVQEKPNLHKPLYGVPIIIKDNIFFKNHLATNGSSVFKNFVAKKSAEVVNRLQEAGAIIVGTSLMAPFAFDGHHTNSGSQNKIPKNVHNLELSTAGSSGGSVAAVASGSVLGALGTDTGNSIRGPSSFLGLVGLRPTHGKIPMDGIFPVFKEKDVVGPITKNVVDNFILYSVLTNDTKNLDVKITEIKNTQNLKGIHIAVIESFYQASNSDPVIKIEMEKFINNLTNLGAKIKKIPNISIIEKTPFIKWWCLSHRYDLEKFFKDYEVNLTYKEILESEKLEEFPKIYMNMANQVKAPLREDPSCKEAHKNINKLETEIVKNIFKKQKIDFIIYPSWNRLPHKLNEVLPDYGNNSIKIAPHLGLPALALPITHIDGIPVGIEIMGTKNSEFSIYKTAFVVEKNSPKIKFPLHEIFAE